MSRRRFVPQAQVSKLSTPRVPTKSKKISVQKSLNANGLENVKELEAKYNHLTKLLKDGRKHAGLQLQLATTKQRLSKAKEMLNINTLINVKSVHPQKTMSVEATNETKHKSCALRSLSQQYGNYYSMRSNILHMEVNKQAIIESKGLQEFLSQYQNKLAKCFKFEQNLSVADQFATNRIKKLSEKNAENTLDNSKEKKDIISEESITEVFMERDIETLVSITSSCEEFDYHATTPKETNFLSQFLNDKVLEFLQAAVEGLGNWVNISESVCDAKLEELMTIRTKSNQSVETITEKDFNLKSKFNFSKCSVTDLIPIKHANAMTDIKKML